MVIIVILIIIIIIIIIIITIIIIIIKYILYFNTEGNTLPLKLTNLYPSHKLW